MLTSFRIFYMTLPFAASGIGLSVLLTGSCFMRTIVPRSGHSHQPRVPEGRWVQQAQQHTPGQGGPGPTADTLGVPSHDPPPGTRGQPGVCRVII